MKDTIQPNTLTLDLEAIVTSAYYKIDRHGALSVYYKTDKDHYIKQLEKELGYTLLKIFPSTDIDICAGDEIKFEFDSAESSDTLFAHIFKKADPKPGHSRIKFNLDIDKCPVCNSTLTEDKCCLNSNCQAKLAYSVRRFLQIATLETWRLEEILLFDKLVTVGKIRHIADIYKITQDQVNSLGVWFSKSERYVGFGVCDKIARTRGTVTLYNYLKFIDPNKPHDDWYIDEDKLSKSFDDISDFLLGLFADSSKANNVAVRECMNESTYAFLYTYFSTDEAFETVKRLIDEDVFDS